MDKPKQPLTEERLKKLAEARKKALEVKKMKGDIARAKKQEKKEALEKEYKEVVVRKKNKTPFGNELPRGRRSVDEHPRCETVKEETLPIEETDKDIYKEQEAETESEGEVVVPKKPLKQKVGLLSHTEKRGAMRDGEALVCKANDPTPDYKQLYYQQKLAILQQQQEEEQFKQQYARLPPYAHTIDIAKQSIKERVDKTIYDQVYKQLFSS